MNLKKHIYHKAERPILVQNPMITTTTQLWAAIKTVWLYLYLVDFRRLVASVSSQDFAFCQARENPTR